MELLQTISMQESVCEQDVNNVAAKQIHIIPRGIHCHESLNQNENSRANCGYYIVDT
jgi:hypothetical protein